MAKALVPETSKAGCIVAFQPSSVPNRRTSQGNHQIGLLQTDAIKGKLLWDTGRGCSLSGFTITSGCGQGYASQAPTGHPCDGAGQGFPRYPKSQGALAPADQFQLPVVKADEAKPRASHLVLHSLVYLDTPEVPAKKHLVCLPLVGPYHVVSKFMVSLNHVQGDHKVDVGISVPQLVEFNIH